MKPGCLPRPAGPGTIQVLARHAGTGVETVVTRNIHAMELERLRGVVERLTYVSQDGYTVLRLKARGHAELVTVVGHLPDVSPGESLKLDGSWVHHSQYGRQFKVERCEQLLPATLEGIRRYLGSGLIKGVGPVTAERIVKRFGLETLQILDEDPGRVREALGVGPKRAELIAQAWEEQKAIKEVMLFLQSHGVSTNLAVKIYKTYGDAALAVVQEDPYRLARDIWGVGFKTADKLAQDLGLPHDAPNRVQAGVAYTLSQLADEGHVYAPEEELVNEASQILEVDPELVNQAVEALDTEELVKRETLVYGTHRDAAAGQAQHLREERAVYLTPFYFGEVGVSNRLRSLVETPASRLERFRQVQDWEAFLTQLTWSDGLNLTEGQQSAVRTALTNKVTVLTGGPGTGKTTTMRTVITALERVGYRYALASPTGRAAKRLGEATGRPAKTVHRLLGYKPTEGFRHNEKNPLPVDMLVVDEASMLDLLLTNHLLKALDAGTHLLLVGDVDQLPSVGAGDVLRDIIAAEGDKGGQGEGITVVRLDTIFRQAAGSYIIENSHRINRGRFPLVNKGEDFFLFTQDEPDQAAALLVDIVQNRIPRKFGLHPIDDIQVLSPMHRGAVGVAALNRQLQAALNPPGPDKPERRLGGRVLRVGDKLMQVRNNYDKETFNGDIGRLVHIDLENQSLTVNIDDQPIRYDWMENDELVHAYAISVHKSQGSEFPAIVIPVMTQHYLMLQRNLLYTAVTRARRLVVLVGQRKAISIAIRNNQVSDRYSGLRVRLGL
jgi:exodeoxyribonuclease V alpha subunit